MKQSGIDRIWCSVPWGIHEPMRGIRDFGKSSRLHLERFFGVAAAAEISLSLSIGFFPGRCIYPDWTLVVPRTSLVPIGAWDRTQSGYTLVALPSMFNEELLTGFSQFLAELCPILSLYIHPEGPIHRVDLRWELYEQDQNLVEHPNFSSLLCQQYKDIQGFNSIYQTAFNSFESAGSRIGFRNLLEKRPWLAAQDYKLG